VSGPRASVASWSAQNQVDFISSHAIIRNTYLEIDIMTEKKITSAVSAVEEKPKDAPQTGGEPSKFGLEVSAMNEAGLHFGHRTSRVHPKMKPNISGVRNMVHVIDLEKSKESLGKALNFIARLANEDKKILFVGTKVQMKELLKNTAIECKASYVNDRWLGGTLTNFKTIKKRIDYFKDLEDKKQKGELDKYTKKERIKIDEELKDLEAKFGGLRDLAGLPDAIFVLDLRKDALAVREANMKGVPVIAICDTNVNPELATYPILANDDALSSISYILSKVKDVIIKK